jgi:predicted nicotinamide N-methyase
VLRALIQAIFHRPTYRFGKVDNARIRRTTLRNAQFVSFMAQQGLGRARYSDGHDARLRRQKIMRFSVACGVIAAVAWVGIESARALSMF